MTAGLYMRYISQVLLPTPVPWQRVPHQFSVPSRWQCLAKARAPTVNTDPGASERSCTNAYVCAREEREACEPTVHAFAHETDE